MSRTLIDEICRNLRGATPSDPAQGDLDSWKVGGKMFATFGIKINGVSLKTDSIETAQMLIDAGAATKAPYFHRSWVLVPFDAAPSEMQHRVQVSYDTITASLSKKVRDAL